MREIRGRESAEPSESEWVSERDTKRERERENRERRKRPRACVRERGWETLERLSCYLG